MALGRGKWIILKLLDILPYFFIFILHRRESDRNAYYTWVYGLEAALVTLSCIGQNIHADDPLEDLLILLV